MKEKDAISLAPNEMSIVMEYRVFAAHARWRQKRDASTVCCRVAKRNQGSMSRFNAGARMHYFNTYPGITKRDAERSRFRQSHKIMRILRSILSGQPAETWAPRTLNIAWF